MPTADQEQSRKVRTKWPASVNRRTPSSAFRNGKQLRVLMLAPVAPLALRMTAPALTPWLGPFLIQKIVHADANRNESDKRPFSLGETKQIGRWFK